MSEKGRWVIKTWLSALAELPKDHPDYEAHSMNQALIYAAAAGGFVCGAVVGVVIGLLVF